MRSPWLLEEPPLRGALPALLLITLVAIGIRMALVSQAMVIEPDGAFYARLAQDLLRDTGTRGFHPAWPPGYPHWIAAMSNLLDWLGLFRESPMDAPQAVEHAARLASALAGGLLPLPVFVLAWRMRAPRLGLLAAILVAGHPALLDASIQVMTESTFALLFMTSAALLFRPGRGQPGAWSAAGAGGVAGLALLTRPEALALVAVGGLYLLLRTRPETPAPPGTRQARPGAALGTALGTTLLYVVTALLVAFPHCLRVSRAVGHASFGAKSDYNLGLAYAGLPGVPEIVRSRSVYNNLTGAAPRAGFPEPIPAFHWVALVQHRPWAVARRVLRQLPVSASALFSLATPPVLILLLLLLARGWKWLAGWRPGLLTWLWVGYVSLYALVFVYRRFFVPFLPLPLLGAAAALRLFRPPWRPRDPAPPGRRRGTLPIQCALALALAGAGVALEVHRLHRTPWPLEQRALGEWLRGAVPPDPPGTNPAGVPSPGVMARRPTVAWYADRPILSIPEGGVAEFDEQAPARGAGWVVIDARDLVQERPEVGRLLSTGADSVSGPPGWSRIHETGRAPFRAVLFAVVRPPPP